MADKPDLNVEVEEVYVRGIVTVLADKPAREMVVVIESNDDRKLAIRLQPGMVGSLVLALRDKLPAVMAPDQGEAAQLQQPLTITGARTFSGTDGVGAILEIENFEVPLLLPAEIIDGLRAMLDEAEALSKNPPTPKRN